MPRVRNLLAIGAGLALLAGCFGRPASSELAVITAEIGVAITTAAPTPPPLPRGAVAKPPPTFVSQSAPLWMSIEPGILPQTWLHPDGIRTIDGAPIIPVDNRPVFRTDSNQPGTDSPGTSFIVGHNYRDPSGAYVPFAALEKVQTGDSVTLGTVNGVLTYTIEQVFLVPKDELPNRLDLLENVPGRLILETCDTTPSGDDTTDNLVVITQVDR